MSQHSMPPMSADLGTMHVMTEPYFCLHLIIQTKLSAPSKFETTRVCSSSTQPF